MNARVTTLMSVAAVAALFAAASTAGAQAKPVQSTARHSRSTAARAAARENKEETAALHRARTEPRALLKGVKLTKAERTSVADIEKRYSTQLRDLAKQEDAAEKAGTPDAAVVSRIDAIRTQERADLRAALSASQQTRFDKNASALDAKK